MPRILCLALLIAWAAPQTALAQSNAAPWKAKAPTRDAARWATAIRELEDEKLHFGAVLAAQRMLGLFQDVQAREIAYRALITAVERGYPFSVVSSFQSGEIEPSKRDRFASTYFTYRGILAERAGNPKWSDAAFRRVEAEKTPAFLFHQGFQAYSKGDLERASDRFRAVLALTQGQQDRASAVKAARSLARVLFEQQRFADSHAIYRDFLLRLNPMFAQDWLEAAWSAYSLGNQSLALGYLYNLESESTRSEHLLEKYLLRGLVHQRLCSEPQIRELIGDFKLRYGDVLDAIRKGQSFARLPVLREIRTLKSADYWEARDVRITLEKEYPLLRRLSSSSRSLVGPAYLAETQRLQKKEAFLAPSQANAAAEQLLTVAKSLDFLRFELERSRYRPELAFRKTDEDLDLSVTEVSEGPGLLESVPLAWRQSGDFWRSERMKYQAKAVSQCGP